MEPTLSAGQGLLAIAWPRVRVGELRVLEHPRRPDFWLVKRVAELHDGGRMSVMSDDPDVENVDSRSFGKVPTAGSYRVVWRSRGSVTTKG